MHTQNQQVEEKKTESINSTQEENVEKSNCGLKDKLAVRISTTSGSWPDENLFYEIDLDTPIQETLNEAAEALNLASVTGFIAKECQKELDLSKSFRQLGLRHLVEIDYSKLEKGGGSHPLLSQEIFNSELRKLTKSFLSSRNWKLLNKEYPNLEIEMNADNRDTFIVSAECSDYPSQVPSYIFKNKENKTLTKIEGIRGGGFINLGCHPISRGSFICTPGAREYHTHRSHVNDKWENHRAKLHEYGIIAMLSKIYNFWIKGGN